MYMSIYHTHIHNMFMISHPVPCFKRYLCRYTSTTILLNRNHVAISKAVELYTVYFLQYSRYAQYVYLNTLLSLHKYISIYVYLYPLTYLHILIQRHTITKLITL